MYSLQARVCSVVQVTIWFLVAQAFTPLAVKDGMAVLFPREWERRNGLSLPHSLGCVASTVVCERASVIDRLGICKQMLIASMPVLNA